MARYNAIRKSFPTHTLTKERDGHRVVQNIFIGWLRITPPNMRTIHQNPNMPNG
jgi:hypothetical protein